MIKLHTFGPAFNLPDPSPFVIKIDLALRISQLPYQSVAGTQNLRIAPKSKLPFINDDGEIIADSSFILDHLKRRYQFDLDSHLSTNDKAMSYLLGKSLEENLYWTVVYSRWIRGDTWPKIKQQFFAGLPFPLNHLIAQIARRSTRNQIEGHGLGKHSNEEIIIIAHKSWSALSEILGDKPYYFGDKISSLDVISFAMLAGFSVSSLKTELGEQLNQYPTLISHCQRIAEQYYPSEITLIE